MSKYFNLNDILDLDIPDNILKEVQDKFGKRVFYDDNSSCKVGTLVGVAVQEHPEIYYYIIDINGTNNYVSVWKSVTKV